ncbi:MAG: hypothetical protein GKS07_10185 [Nitrosopumilus sp.]|nr:MAG: hypothetical protein GKS07_10185 [Nitrosopumilus sp.]
MTNYFENLRKRIIWIIIGILCYYFAIIPISLISHVTLPGIGLSYFSGFSSYQLVSMGLLFYFVYRALFKVNPSFMPLIKKYKKILLVFVIITSTSTIVLPSGLIVPEWEQGECRISSSMIMQDGTSQGSTTSQTMTGISECLDHCRHYDDFNPKLEKTCQFRGLFDSVPTVMTNESTEYDGKIAFDGKIR